jgi:hypothetical protein
LNQWNRPFRQRPDIFNDARKRLLFGDHEFTWR